MNKVIQNILVFIAFCLVGYLVFRNMNEIHGVVQEGFASGAHVTPHAVAAPPKPPTSTTGPGVAGNAALYASTLKAQSIQTQDTLLITKYKSDYENVIINMSDLVNNLMLQTVLSANATQPQSVIEALTTLNALNGSQAALNNVMKFIDSN
jgi:hypothetical protein